GAAGERAAAPLVVERLQRGADARAARPVDHALGCGAQGFDRIVRRELPGEAGEPRAERERLDSATGADGRVQVEDERPRVRLHRAGDVAEQDEPTGRLLPAAEGALERVTACGDRAAGQPSEVEGAAAGVRTQAARSATRAGGRDLGDERPEAVELVGRHRTEVLRAQHLAGA